MIAALGCAQVAVQASSPEPAPAAPGSFDLEPQLDHLVTQISAQMSGSQKTSVAVIEFSDLDGKVTRLGRLFSEELITRLFETRKFNVVEREMLTKILSEQKLQASGLIDEDSARKLGKLLGVDAIVTGSISDLAHYIRVNARMINTETGMVFGVASATILKDESIQRLMGSRSPGNEAGSPSAVPPPVLGRSARAAPSQGPGAARNLPPSRAVAAADSALSIPWMDVNAFRAEIKKKWDAGYWPATLEGRQPMGHLPHEYRATMQPMPVRDGHRKVHFAYGLTQADYDAYRGKMLAEGLQETSLQYYSDRNQAPRYQTCWATPGQ